MCFNFDFTKDSVVHGRAGFIMVRFDMVRQTMSTLEAPLAMEIGARPFHRQVGVVSSHPPIVTTVVGYSTF